MDKDKTLDTDDIVSDQDVVIDLEVEGGDETLSTETKPEKPEDTKPEVKAEEPAKTDEEDKPSGDYVEDDEFAIPPPEDVEGRKNFGARAKKRISQLVRQKKEFEEQLAAAREEHAQAVQFAQQAQRQQEVAVHNAWRQAELGFTSQLALAKKELKDANVSGEDNSEAIEKITALQVQIDNAKRQRTALEARLKAGATVVTPQRGDNQEPVQRQEQRQVSEAKPSEKALAWKERSPWFGKDEVMTSAALGVHNKLIKEGVDPDSDDYYGELDSQIRALFPGKFKVKPVATQTQTQVAAPSRVAPTTKKQATLTPSQQRMAKKLGVSFKDYALQFAHVDNGGKY